MRRRLVLVALGALAACALIAAPANAIIVGGHDADEGEYPYAAALDGTAYSCTGSLIDEQWILTAAHCIVLYSPAGAPAVPAAHISARVGSVSSSSGGTLLRGLVAYVHPSYDGLSMRNDVALIQMSSKATGIPTVKIAGAGEEPTWASGTLSTIVGWGVTEEDGNSPDTLQEAQVPVVADGTCSEKVDGFDASTMLCAAFVGKGGVDTCQGDSGGPLLVPIAGGGFRQAGITSWGNGCARPEDPGVYARIGAGKLRDFVSSHVPGAIGSGAKPPSAETSAQAPAPASTGSTAPASGSSAPSGSTTTTAGSAPAAPAGTRTAPAAANKKAKRTVKRCKRVRRGKRVVRKCKRVPVKRSRRS